MQIPVGRIALTLFLSSTLQLSAKPSTDWYKDAGFGMFIHWGLYSQVANNWNDQRFYGIGEWIMHRQQIPAEEYKKVAHEFNPVAFDAEAWVKFAKSAGMKYIIITSKHHDGFAMFDSAVSDFDIIDATPFGRDPLKELAAACEKHGIKLGFYYSQTQDWTEPDAVGNTWDYNPEAADFDRYLKAKVRPQLEELLTNYGDLGMIWFDTPQNITPEESDELVAFVHEIQPNCLTTSRVGNGRGDYICLQDHQLPSRVSQDGRPTEALFTHNDSWGFTDYDRNYRSPREIIHLLTMSNSYGANLLFNVGPKADGTMPEQSVADLKVVGRWMEQNGESIYEAEAAPFPPLAWGVATRKPNQLFLHILDYPPHRQLRVPQINATIGEVSLLASGAPLEFKKDGEDLLISLPEVIPDRLNTVVKVTFSGELTPHSAITLIEEMSSQLSPFQASREAGVEMGYERWMEEFGDWKHADFMEWKGKNSGAAQWDLRIPQHTQYFVQLEYRFHDGKNRPEGIIQVGDEKLYFEAFPTGTSDHHFYQHRIGIISFPPGAQTLSIKPVDPEAPFIQLRSITLIPVI